MDSDGPHNQAGGTDSETGAKVLPFRGEWFGSPDELVPFGPRARAEKNASGGGTNAAANRTEPVTSQEESAPSRPAEPMGQPHVGADDFWAGLADAGDLVQFPAPSDAAAAAVPASSSLGSGGRAGRLAVAAAVLGLVVIGLRLSNGVGGGALQHNAARTHTASSVAKSPVGGAAVDQQQMRAVPFPVQLPTQAHRARPKIAGHPPSRITRRILVSQPRPSSVHTQPAVYSTTPPAQTPSAPVSGAGTRETSSGSAGDGGGGSGGGRSHGGGSHRSGPTGRAAAFGPGKMGG